MVVVNIKLGDKTLKGLSGYIEGFFISNEQISTELEKALKNNEKLIVKFPENIEDISISFVMGFISGLEGQIHKREINEKLIIDGTQKVKDDFEVGLLFNWGEIIV